MEFKLTIYLRSLTWGCSTKDCKEIRPSWSLAFSD